MRAVAGGRHPLTDRHTEVLASWTTATSTGEQFTAAWADLHAADNVEPQPFGGAAATAADAGDTI